MQCPRPELAKDRCGLGHGGAEATFAGQMSLRCDPGKPCQLRIGYGIARLGKQANPESDPFLTRRVEETHEHARRRLEHDFGV